MLRYLEKVIHPCWPTPLEATKLLVGTVVVILNATLVFTSVPRRGEMEQYVGLDVSFIHSKSMTWCSVDNATPRFALQEGQILRLRGKGAPSLGDGEAGDALVEISINPHRFFARHGDNIHIDLPPRKRFMTR